jgi:hypothetical protein
MLLRGLASLGNAPMTSHTAVTAWAGILCLVLLGCGASAKDVPQPGDESAAAAEQQPSVSYDGVHPATLRYGDLTITFDRTRALDDLRMPVIKGHYQGRVVFSFRMDMVGRPEPSVKARVIRLDRSTALSQIVITAFTGGAHCCVDTRVVTMTAAGKWYVVPLGEIDGIEGFEFKDLDGDGADELISYDNSFFYAFASYADSGAPTMIQRFVAGKLVNATHEPRFEEFLRTRLHDMENSIDEAQWHNNGFLGAWVAAKGLVGEVDEAWQKMLTSYDKDSDWIMEECLVRARPGKCPDSKKRQLAFPQALLKHLTEQGYPLPAHPDIPRR